MPVGTLAENLLDPRFERDGVSILGGEPFAQAESLLALVKELRGHGCQHILCYSGYTLETLMEKAKQQSAIGEVLADIEMLIDGAYIEALAYSAGAWTGSSNQRVIDMRETRRADQIVLYNASCYSNSAKQEVKCFLTAVEVSAVLQTTSGG